MRKWLEHQCEREDDLRVFTLYLNDDEINILKGNLASIPKVFKNFLPKQFKNEIIETEVFNPKEKFVVVRIWNSDSK